jgi:hypothetical protein
MGTGTVFKLRIEHVLRVRDIFIPDPDFYLSRIPDPTTATKEKG